MKYNFQSVKLKVEKLVGSLLSRPAPIDLPDELGLHAAAVAVSLPAGCQPPPGPIGYRLAAGWGETAEEAATKALLEGVERYSIQYQNNDPPVLSPVHAYGTESRFVPSTSLLLGHRDAAEVSDDAKLVTSVGSAAGVNVEDAGLRALLENFEYAARTAWLASKPDGIALAIDGSPILCQLRDALDKYGRRMALYAVMPARGVVAVMCINCGQDGSGAVVASASSTDLATACRHASVEAAMLWRNMMAMAKQGLVLDTISPTDRQHVVRYLQGWPSAAWPSDEDLRPLGVAAYDLNVPAKPLDTPPTLAEVAAAADVPCLLFDLTRAEAGVPVARVMMADTDQ
ncbi:MAG: YcaO-like family protein [Pseudomonadota bacterium]